MIGKSVVIAWLLAGTTSFLGIDLKSGDATTAAVWASLSALGAALITGVVRIIIGVINTARSRREQREIEIANDINRIHGSYAQQIKFLARQCRNETNILRVVRKSKHALLSDVGARDLYIDVLEDILREHHVKFTRMTFRNTAEASLEEDDQIQRIVSHELVLEAASAIASGDLPVPVGVAAPAN